jgi:hypothetical protein
MAGAISLLETVSTIPQKKRSKTLQHILAEGGMWREQVGLPVTAATTFAVGEAVYSTSTYPGVAASDGRFTIFFIGFVLMCGKRGYLLRRY